MPASTIFLVGKQDEAGEYGLPSGASLTTLNGWVEQHDFGTGYSSLAYLRQFPIDVLKIDRSFVSGIADTTESAALVHTLVQLGKVLGLETIAEGIETDDPRLRFPPFAHDDMAG